MKKITFRLHLSKIKKYGLLYSCLLIIGCSLNTFAQQNVFHRDNAGTGDWGSGNLPWFYQTSNNNQGDPDNNNSTRNDVFIGHNNNTTMSLNGRFYIHRDFTFQAAASTGRTLNNTTNGGFSFSRSLRNESTATHIFNTPVAIDGNNSEILLTNNGSLTFNGSVFTNSNTVFIRNINGNLGTVTFSGPMTQGGSIVKQNGGLVNFIGSADFNGSLFIDEGTLRVGRNWSSNTIEIGGGILLSTAFNANLEIANGGTTISKAIIVKNFNSTGGNRSITFSHPSSTIATISGTLALEKEVTINNPSSNDGAFFSGVASGSGGIIKAGNGNVTLSAVNTYTGTTTVSAGTLILNRVGGGTIPSSNSVTVNGGTLRISSDQSLSNLTLTTGSLIVDPTVTLTLNNVTIPNGFVITNNGTINITGTLTDNRTTKTFGGTVQYSGAAQSVVGGSYNNLSFLNSGTKTFGGSSSVAGNFVVTTATGVAPSTMTFNGGSAQNIAGLAYNNIEFSGTGSKTFTSNASVSSASSISFSGTGATVDFDGASNNVIFELKSDNSGTAGVANATGWTLNGNVTVERFIPSRRAWRILTAPLTGTTNNTISANWQGTNGEGVLLFSPASLGYTGYVAGGGSPNIRKYNAGWENINNLTTEPMFGATPTDTKPFLVFPTGPSNSTNFVTGSDATTLRPKGQLITGSVNHTGLAVNTFHALANPYASAINPVTLLSNPANAGQKIWVIRSSIGSFGAYVTFDGTDWSLPLPAPTGSEAVIQSGQGFFVRSASATSFTIRENDKVAGSSNYWLQKNASETSDVSTADRIRVLLYKQTDNNWNLTDGTLTVNYQSGSNEVNAMDSNKIANFNESIMFRNNTTSLSIEHRALPIVSEIQPIRLTGTTALPYQLRVRTENYSNSTLLPVLEDTAAGTFTAIPTDGTEVVIPFSGTVATTTSPDNRFRIVYQVNLSNVEQSPLVASVFPNPVTNNQLNIHLGTNNETANYTITNLLGQFIQKGTLANTQNVITLSSISQGFYLLNITQDGKSFTTKIYVQ